MPTSTGAAAIDQHPDQSPSGAGVPWLTRLAGRFIVFDGPDGSGKSTQLERFRERCAEAGVRVCDVREPGGTAIGERIREILLDESAGEMSPRCEMLLYMASRAQLVSERIRPALSRGELVLADRFVSSTLAYQGAGGGVPVGAIEAVTEAACEEVRPDLTVIFDVGDQTASERMGERDGGSRDRIESRDAEYRRRVRAGYLEQAKREPERVAIVDASPAPEAVERAMLAELRKRFG
jgi:dTMP kinase